MSITLHIDGKPYRVASGRNLLETGLTLGLDIPYFCWHPALGSVGACRQCAVKQFKDENDTVGRLVMACMVPVTDGLRVSVLDPEAREFRRSVVEWLMTNHPHDCPICDEGGECHLQDMTVMTGHAYRRHRFPKRTFRNQDLGPFINHEMNRCIQCYRCVRFYQDYAGGSDLRALASGNAVYFGRHEDGTLENEFSGNLIEVCPTGVFTDKTLKRHYTRKWDLHTAPSVCAHCGLGCNTILGERNGELRRVLNRYHPGVNGYFLCDRGRFGYEFVNHPRRLRSPLGRPARSAPFETVTKEELLARLGPRLADPARIVGIGSPRASIEANYALRSWVGPARFFSGMSERETSLVAEVIDTLRRGRVRTPSLSEIERADAVLILGEDLTQTAPRMALALRQSVRQEPLRTVDALHVPRWLDKSARDVVQHRHGPLFMACPAQTRLDDVASETWHGAPDEIARLGFAVAHALDPAAPGVEGLSSETLGLARRIAGILAKAKQPLVISGVSLGSRALVQAAANVAWALEQAGHAAFLSYIVPESNSMGLGLLEARSWSDALRLAQSGEVDAVIVLENDLGRRAPAAVVDALVNRVKIVVTIDSLENMTTTRADAVLPCGTHAESSGTFVNNEGRAQRFFRVLPPHPVIEESWRWIADLRVAAGEALETRWNTLDDVIEAVCSDVPILGRMIEAAPLAKEGGMKFGRASRRFSGRTAIGAHRDLHEPKPPIDPDSPLTFSMEGYPAPPPPAVLNQYWVPGWNSVQALNRFQEEVGGPLRGDEPGVRLIEPAAGPAPDYHSTVPGALRAGAGDTLVVAVHHIFGSEELSARSPAVAQLAPEAYLGLNDADAAMCSVSAGDALVLRLGGSEHHLRARIVPGLPNGMACLPAGLPGLEGIELPALGRWAAEVSGRKPEGGLR